MATMSSTQTPNTQKSKQPKSPQRHKSSKTKKGALNGEATVESNTEKWQEEDSDDFDDEISISSGSSEDKILDYSSSASSEPTKLKPARRRRAHQKKGWTPNASNGNPLVTKDNTSNPQGGNSGNGQGTERKDYGGGSGFRDPRAGYPTNDVNYPHPMNGGPHQSFNEPYMGRGQYPNQYPPLHYGQPCPYLYPAPYGWAHQPQQNPWITPPPAPTKTPTPTPPKADPEKIRLEAEIAALKAMQEKANAAKKQRETEAQIRKEAEEALCKRMEDMRLAQEEAKREIERSMSEAENAARERMEAERKAEEKRKEAELRAKAIVEEQALRKLQEERNSEEEKLKRFREFALNLEKEVRFKVHLEQRIELTEQEAKERQTAENERLARAKVLQSMNDIINLAKRKAFHDMAADGNLSVDGADKMGWWMERRDDSQHTERQLQDRNSGRNSRFSVRDSKGVFRYATVSTAESVSDTSSNLADTCKHPAAPDPPASSSDTEDEAVVDSSHGALHKNESEPGQGDPGQARDHAKHEPEQFRAKRRAPEVSQVPEIIIDEASINQIANAVIRKLVQSSDYGFVIGRQARTDSPQRQVFSPETTHLHIQPCSRSEPSLPESEGEKESAPIDHNTCETSSQITKPPKPAHLRGRRLEVRPAVSSSDMSTSGRKDVQGEGLKLITRGVPSNHGDTRPLSPANHSPKANGHGQGGEPTSLLDIDLLSYEPSTTYLNSRAAVINNIDFSVPITETSFRGEGLMSSQSFGQDQEEALERAYKHIFHL